jgi:DNA (cytosine-5)-methyltransferase 1
MSSPLEFIDLFAGLGGFRVALESLGLKCVFSSDIDKDAQDAYEENHGDRPAGDIRNISAEEMPRHDVICAGTPCQSWSIAGKKLGFKDPTRGTLFFEMVKIAAHHRPPVLFLENVPNLKSHDDGKTIAVMVTSLEAIGYKVHHRILNASDYGCPTARERIYLVCFREDLDVKNFEFPPPTGVDTCLRDFLLPDSETGKYVSDREFVFRDSFSREEDMFGKAVRTQAPVRIGNLRGMTGQGCRVYSDTGHAVTLTRAGGGVGGSTGLYLVNGKVRKLAPRECFRIMGYPDSFKMPANDRKAYHLIGNSVAVPVLREIFKKVLEALSEKQQALAEGRK